MSGNEIFDNKFGAQTIFALRHTGEICGSNGLPLTPKSIGILGRAQILKTLKHEYLASYLDFIRGKHGRLLIVSEYNKFNLKLQLIQEEQVTIRIAYQILQALTYLNLNGIVHRMLSSDNILLDDKGNIKLFNYGLYHMTNCGRDVEFPIGLVKYLAPEVLLSTFNPDYDSGPKVDVWSLGVILTEVIFQKELWSTLKLGQSLRKVVSLIYCDDVLNRFARETDSLQIYEKINVDLKDFLESCLHIDVRKRKMPEELLKHKVFDEISKAHQCDISDLGITEAGHPLNAWQLHELYYLWQLAGGDVHSELKRNGLIKTKPPILSIPNLILLEGMSFGHIKDPACILDLKVVPLSLDTLTARLNHIPFDAFYPLIEMGSHLIDKFNEHDVASENLPLVIRERDTEYQFRRIVLYSRLLQGYPYTKTLIYEEAHKDIPPYFRGEIWTVLLNVKGDIESQYTRIDKETPIPTDRQIEVDIPRCHQYNELLSSKAGHQKLKRILKAWVISSERYVYWQGLDSLCAPFLYLNFNNEARAYACFAAFIPKYLYNFFLKDNSAVIKEYLAKFSHLITFHDPVLANHLHDINFVPELFAIPWFLTMFSHVFPLHKIFHLWDKLLLGDSSYPLFVGLAILQQLRDTLLTSGFNECILLFSDLPEIDIERCVINSSLLYADTPRSITFRKFQIQSTTEPDYTLTDSMLIDIEKEINPRLSVSDFLQLVNCKDTRSNVLIVDTRTSMEYSEKSVPGSINIPYNQIDFDKDVCTGIPFSPELSILINNKGKMIVVIAERACEAAKVCSFFTADEFSKVCFLHGGIEVLYSSGILAPVII